MIPGATPAEQLARDFLTHLQHESVVLQQQRQLLLDIRAAILDRDQQRLLAAVAHQAELEPQVRQITVQRQALRRALAAELGLAPQRVNLRQLVDHLRGPMRDQLQQQADGLNGLAREVDRLTRGNAALIQTQVQLLQQLLACLTGRSMSPPRYGSSGGVESSVTGSIFETRC
jgi:hypothetical protein